MKAIFATALLAGGLAAAAHAEPPGPPPAERARFNPDTNHDGYVSRSEAIAAAAARFSQLDRNGDGKLTRDEAMPPERRRQGPGPAGPDGPPPPEAEAQTGGPPGADAGDRHPWMKRRWMMARMRHAEMARRADLLFEEYDRNRDGAIEPSEYRAWAIARFDALDGNHDGKVKLPERRRPMHEPGRWGPAPESAPAQSDQDGPPPPPKP